MRARRAGRAARTRALERSLAVPARSRVKAGVYVVEAPLEVAADAKHVADGAEHIAAVGELGEAAGVVVDRDQGLVLHGDLQRRIEQAPVIERDVEAREG